jgi:hypothetical protein
MHVYDRHYNSHAYVICMCMIDITTLLLMLYFHVYDRHYNTHAYVICLGVVIYLYVYTAYIRVTLQHSCLRYMPRCSYKFVFIFYMYMRTRDIIMPQGTCILYRIAFAIEHTNVILTLCHTFSIHPLFYIYT